MRPCAGGSIPVRGRSARRRGGPALPGAAPSGQAPARLLLVEDNEINARLATALAERMGHEVVCVGNGREAVDALRQRGGGHRGFDLVLMDVHMPEMDGLAATRAIRALGHGGNGSGPGTVPVIAMTANAMTDDRAACLEAGMDDYLPKPFDVEDLAAMLERWSGRRSTAAGSPLS